MCERILEGRKRKTKNEEDEAMGFGNFGSYFDAKKSKLVDQFKTLSTSTVVKSKIFQGVAIFVNGLTNPNASELRRLMAEHCGVFHGYQMSSTTHIIASNLAYAKTKNLGSVPIVKPSWITDSIELKKLMDYKRYLLFTNQSAAQPKLNFPVLPEMKSVKSCDSKIEEPLIELVIPKENALSCSSSDSLIKSDSSAISFKGNESLMLAIKCDNTIEKCRITKTASDPLFLEEFYNNSRLHLIATMGAEFKQLVGQLRDRSNGEFPGKEMLLLKGNSNSKRTYSSVIMHIDMDCFFVSVGLRNRPELKGKPVAVTHARNGQISSSRPGRSAEIAMNLERAPENIVEKISSLDSHSSMSEVACCSYEARKCGIKNGMFLGTAIKYCPNLKTIQYDFQGYKDVAATLYRTVASYTLDIEAVSCDEMYVDITKLLNESGLTVDQFATHLRSEIMEKTQCPCSTGFGANKLQARLATKKAKPNGQFHLEVDDVETHFAEISLGDLPGVGRATLSKLKNLGLNTCGDVQMASLSLLQAELGQKIGETLLEQAKGIDRKPLNFHHERKSVSAEINYGIRFKTQEESYKFLLSLSQEVFNRLNDVGTKAKCSKAKCLTLKLMVRSADAPVETAKFLGHGICDSLSKSTTSHAPIADVQTIFKEAKQLYDKFNVPYADLRGVGIQLSKLEKIGPVNSVMSNFLKQSSNKKASSEFEVLETTKEKKLALPEETQNRVTEAQASKEYAGRKSGERISPQKTTSNQKMNETKSKRGRPPGSKCKVKSSKNKPSPSPMLNRYLKNMGWTPTKVNTILTSNEIDMNVLYELPEELRNEIMKEYKLQQPSDSKKTLGKDMGTVPDTKVDKTKHKIEQKKSLFEGLSWEKLKPVLKAWMTSEDKPKKIDIEMISAHFRQLAIDRQIEYLRVVFNFLHRSFSKMNCEWHKAYFSIVNITQQGMVARYGGTLLVERKFDCCRW